MPVLQYSDNNNSNASKNTVMIATMAGRVLVVIIAILVISGIVGIIRILEKTGKNRNSVSA